MLLSILAIVLVFGLIIFVHELGHMLAAKACGVAVPDFSIGMGPSLYHFKLGETRYHLSALPIGGYASIAGLSGDQADAPGAPSAPSFPVHATWQAKNGWQKAFILVAGAAMNLLLAVVAMLAMGLVGFPVNAVVIETVEQGSPAAEAGLQPGDMIRSINGHTVSDTTQFSALVRANRNREIQLAVQRGEQELVLSATPRVIEGFNEGNVSLGVSYGQVFTTTTISLVQPKTIGYELGLRAGDKVTQVNGKPIYNGFELLFSLASFDDDFNPVDEEGNLLGPDDGIPTEITVLREDQELQFTLPGNSTLISLGVQFQPELEHLPLGQSLVRSLRDARNMMLGMLFSIRMMFAPQVAKTVAGPVGIMSIIGQSAQSGWYTFLQIVFIINLNLALLNLLPLPALDGGRLVFVALGGIGIKIPEKREALIHAVGMVMLLGLIGLVTFTDILAFF
jgi:regulator of sigma E protease